MRQSKIDLTLIAVSEDGGRRKWAKECIWAPETESGKKVDIPIEPLERNVALPA